MTQHPPSPVGRPRANRIVLITAVCATLIATAAIAVAASPGSESGPAAHVAAADPQTAAASPGAESTTAPDASAAPDASGKPEWPGRPGRGGFLPGPWGDDGRGFFRGPGDALGIPGAPILGRGGITITAIDGTKLSLATDDGWTRTIDASDATITRGGEDVTVDDLAVGDMILFREQRNDDGSYSVTAIFVLQPHVVGVVSDLTGNSFTVTEPDGSTQTVTVDDSTAYMLGRAEADESALKDGVQVDVEGSTSGDTFAATTVHIFPARVGGTVTATTDSSITVTQRDGTSATIDVDADTAYHVRGAEAGSLGDVTTGDLVIAQGTLKANGTLEATDVVVLGAPDDWQRGPFGRPHPGWPDKPTGPGASPSPGDGA